MPNFEVLDARITSTLNRIIHNSQFKRRTSLEERKAQKQDRFFRGRQIAYLMCEHFRVIGANDSVENYADLLTVILQNDDFQEFDSKWDGIPSSMTKISRDILEGLHKLRTRESEKPKTALELYDLETHQKKLGPDYHRLKAMVKRSIEQNLARSIAKWTKACDRRLKRLFSYIHHTCEYKQYCYGNTAKKCRLGLFPDSDFVGDFEDSKIGWSSLIRVSSPWCAYTCVNVWVHYGSIFGQYLDKNHCLDKNIGLPC